MAHQPLTWSTLLLFAAFTLAHPPFHPTETDPAGAWYWNSSPPPNITLAAIPTGLDLGGPLLPPDPDALRWTRWPSTFNAVRVAHAVLASTAYLLFFPAGGILVHVCRHPRGAWIHGGVQILAYVVFAAAAGLGIWMARTVGCMSDYHPTIGLVLLCLGALQPVMAGVKHRLNNSVLRAQFLGQLHVWTGRVLITVGIINGGLGFQFASTFPDREPWPRSPKIAYGVVATLAWIVYVSVVAVWAELKRVPTPTRRGAGVREEDIQEVQQRGRERSRDPGRQGQPNGQKERGDGEMKSQA